MTQNSLYAEEYTRDDYSRDRRYLGMTAAMTQLPVPTAKITDAHIAVGIRLILST